MSEREKEILLKAAYVLYSLSGRTSNTIAERKYENLATTLENLVDNEFDEEDE